MPGYKIPKDAIVSSEGPANMGGFFKSRGRTTDIELSADNDPRNEIAGKFRTGISTIRGLGKKNAALEGLKKSRD